MHPPGLLVLLPDDRLWLDAGFSMHAGMLHDTIIGVHHQLISPAEVIIACLRQQIRFDDLCAVLRQQSVSMRQLYAVLESLNTIGALGWYRNRRRTSQAAIIGAGRMLLGQRHVPLQLRNRGHPLSLIRAVHYSMSPIIVALLVVGGGLQAIAGWKIAILWVACTYGLLGISVMVHEAAHWWVLTRFGSQAAIVYCRLRISLQHRQLSRYQEQWTAVAGPLAGGACCLLIGIIGLGISPLLLWCGLMTCCFHLYSLCPWQPDGKALCAAVNDPV
jgi:hypothetical protein